MEELQPALWGKTSHPASILACIIIDTTRLGPHQGYVQANLSLYLHTNDIEGRAQENIGLQTDRTASD